MMKIRGSLLSLILIAAMPSIRGQDFEGLKKINGTFLYFKIIGEGEPIVFVHGGPGMNHSYFIPHLNTLARDFKIVMYDQRASGKSAIPSPDSISLKYFADDLEAIRKSLGVEKLNLLGHSWGAIPVVYYGILYPDKVKSMVLCNPVPLSKEFDKEMLENQQKKTSSYDSTDRSIIIGSPDFKAGKPTAYKKLLMFSFRHSFYRPADYTKLEFDMPDNYLQANRALFTGLSKDLNQYDFYEGARNFSFPVLIIQGAADAVPLRASQQAAKNIKKSRLLVIKKAGHFAFIDQPRKFNVEVGEFVRASDKK